MVILDGDKGALRMLILVVAAAGGEVRVPKNLSLSLPDDASLIVTTDDAKQETIYRLWTPAPIPVADARDLAS